MNYMNQMNFFYYMRHILIIKTLLNLSFYIQIKKFFNFLNINYTYLMVFYINLFNFDDNLILFIINLLDFIMMHDKILIYLSSLLYLMSLIIYGLYMAIDHNKQMEIIGNDEIIICYYGYPFYKIINSIYIKNINQNQYNFIL